MIPYCRPKLSYSKSSIRPPGELIYFTPIWGGGGGPVGALETTMVSVHHKELENKVEKHKYKKI